MIVKISFVHNFFHFFTFFFSTPLSTAYHYRNPYPKKIHPLGHFTFSSPKEGNSPLKERGSQNVVGDLESGN